jgi:hypothetical protein
MTSDPRDYKLDISSLQKEPASDAAPAARPYISVLFACCKVYQRVYRLPSGQAYRGRCPKCAREVNFPIGQGGTSARFFRAS